MIFYLLTSSIGWVYYITKGSIIFIYNRYQHNKREKRLKLLEDNVNKQKQIIYKLQFDLEEKSNPDTTFGFEMVNYDNNPTSLKK